MMKEKLAATKKKLQLANCLPQTGVYLPAALAHVVCVVCGNRGQHTSHRTIWPCGKQVANFHISPQLQLTENSDLKLHY